MNVTGVTSPPAVAAPPAVPKVVPSASTETHPQRHPETDAKSGGHESQHAAVPAAPPLKPLSTTEMRVLMGGLPPSAILEAEHARRGGHFDGYA